jgi:hypothetical protein
MPANHEYLERGHLGRNLRAGDLSSLLAGTGLLPVP